MSKKENESVEGRPWRSSGCRMSCKSGKSKNVSLFKSENGFYRVMCAASVALNKICSPVVDKSTSCMA